MRSRIPHSLRREGALFGIGGPQVLHNGRLAAGSVNCTRQRSVALVRSDWWKTVVHQRLQARVVYAWADGTATGSCL